MFFLYIFNECFIEFIFLYHNCVFIYIYMCCLLLFLVFNWRTQHFAWCALYSLLCSDLLLSYSTDDIIRLNKKQKQIQFQKAKHRLPVKGRFTQGKKIVSRPGVPSKRGQNVTLCFIALSQSNFMEAYFRYGIKKFLQLQEKKWYKKYNYLFV